MRLVCLFSLFISLHVSGMSYCPMMETFVLQGQSGQACADCCDDETGGPLSPLKSNTCCIKIGVPTKQTLSSKLGEKAPSIEHHDSFISVHLKIFHAASRVLRIYGNNAPSISNWILLSSWPRAPPAELIHL